MIDIKQRVAEYEVLRDRVNENSAILALHQNPNSDVPVQMNEQDWRDLKLETSAYRTALKAIGNQLNRAGYDLVGNFKDHEYIILGALDNDY